MNPEIDYDALAKKSGSIDSSSTKTVDYDALAKKAGALTLKDIAPRSVSSQDSYDMAGYIAAGGKPKSQGEHYPDTYKLPNHITFSSESKYSNPGQEGGTWKYLDKNGNPMEEKSPGGTWHFYASSFNLKQHNAEELKKYFKEREPGSVLHLPKDTSLDDAGTQLQGEAWGDPEQSKEMLTGLVETVPTMATGLPSFVVGTGAKIGNGVVNMLLGMDKPWPTAVEQTDKLLDRFTYHPGRAGAETTKGLTYGMVAATAPYLLPALGIGEALDTETAKKHIPENERAFLKIVNDALMIAVPSAKGAMAKRASAKTAKLPTPGVTEASRGFESAENGRPVHPDWYEGMAPSEAAKAAGARADAESAAIASKLDALTKKVQEEAAGLKPTEPGVSSGEDPRVTNVPRGENVNPITDYLKESQKQTEFSGNILDDYYKLQGADKADTNRLSQLLDKAKGRPGDYEAIYNHIENPKEPLTPAQNELLKTEIEPIRTARDEVYSRLKESEVPLSDDLYTPRKTANKGGMFDRIMDGFRGTKEGSILGKSSGSMKHRVLMAAENAAGQRRVIAVKGGEVVAWDKGKADPLGPLKFTDFEEMLGKETKPIDREIAKIERELETINAAQGREWKFRDHIKELARKTKIEKLENQKAEILERYNPADLNQRLFKDKDGQTWTIKNATTKEIEANTDLRYHKNSLLNEATTYNNLRRVERATQYLENLKRDPEFNRIAIKIGSQNLPKGYKTTSLPQLRGYAFPDRIAETFDTFYKKSASGLLDSESAYVAVNRVLRNSIFFNPLIHIPNIVNHAFVNRGAQWANPAGYPRLIRTGARAIRDVLTMNENYNKMLEAGAPLLYSETVNRNLYKVMLDKMGAELKTNDPKVIALAKDLGMKPAQLIKAVYDFSGKATWAVNDIATLQSIYEEMDRGRTMEQAIEETGRHIPNYRIPPRIMGSKLVSDLMKGESGVTMFGAYHYGALRSYGEMIKEITGKESNAAVRGEAAGRIAALALATYFIYPQLDKAAQWASGNQNAEVRRAGASTFPANTEKLAKGQIDFAQWVQAVLTPSVGFNVAVESYYGRDPRTGKKISYPEIAKRSLAPISQGSKVAEGSTSISKFLWGLGGVSLRDRPQPTPAEVVMNKLAFHSDKDPDEGMKSYTKIKKDAKELLRKDKAKGESFLIKQWEDKKLSKDQVNRIHREVFTDEGDQVDEFAARFKQYGVSRVSSTEGSYAALKIYAEMTPDQKVKVNDILNEKMQRAWEKAEDPDLPAGQMSEAQQELITEWKKYIPALETP